MRSSADPAGGRLTPEWVAGFTGISNGETNSMPKYLYSSIENQIFEISKKKSLGKHEDIYKMSINFQMNITEKKSIFFMPIDVLIINLVTGNYMK